YLRHRADAGGTVAVQVLDRGRVVTTPQQFPHPTDFRPARLISILLCVETVIRSRHREPLRISQGLRSPRGGWYARRPTLVRHPGAQEHGRKWNSTFRGARKILGRISRRSTLPPNG